MDKHAAEKIASEYHTLGIQLALHNAGLVKTASPVDKLMKALKGGGMSTKKKLLAAGLPLGGAGGLFAALSRRGGAEGAVSKAVSKAAPEGAGGTYMIPGYDQMMSKLTGIPSQLPVQVPYARIGEEGLGGMSRVPATEDLLTQLLKSPAATQTASGSSLGVTAPDIVNAVKANIKNLSGATETASGSSLGITAPDILKSIKSNIQNLSGGQVPMSPMPMPQDVVQKLISGGQVPMSPMPMPQDLVQKLISGG